jgi:hypothetical protein
MNWILIALLSLGYFIFESQASASVRKKVTGNSEHQVKENAFRQGMDYPVGPMNCDQRCSQWWERE